MELTAQLGAAVPARLYKSAKTLEDVIARPARRRWRIFKLLGDKPHLHQDPATLEKALGQAIGTYFEHSARVILHQQALWISVTLNTLAHHYQEHIFIVHPPHSHFLFMTPIRSKENAPVFLQALCEVFDCPNLKELQLFGRDVQVLKDLALQRLSQGAFQSYRLCAGLFDANPLEDAILATKRRRAVIDKVLAEERAKEADALKQGKDRNRVHVKTAIRRPEQRFTADACPGAAASDAGKRNQISQVCLRTKSDLAAPDGSLQVPQFSCFIRFEGRDVLGGVDSLYANDLVENGREVPRVLDANNLLLKHLSVNTQGSSKRRRRDEQQPNSVLWLQTT